MSAPRIYSFHAEATMSTWGCPCWHRARQLEVKITVFTTDEDHEKKTKVGSMSLWKISREYDLVDVCDELSQDNYELGEAIKDLYDFNSDGWDRDLFKATRYRISREYKISYAGIDTLLGVCLIDMSEPYGCLYGLFQDAEPKLRKPKRQQHCNH